MSGKDNDDSLGGSSKRQDHCPDKRERKASASYYTPDHIVKYIVAEAVGHVLKRKFEDMRPRLREAQKWHREMTTLARAKKESVEKYEYGPAVENRWRSLVESLFDIKVLDPAMNQRLSYSAMIGQIAWKKRSQII